MASARDFRVGELVRVADAPRELLHRLAIVLECDETFTHVKLIDTGEEEELFTWRFERAPTEDTNHG